MQGRALRVCVLRKTGRMIMNKNLLKQYARLVAGVGINVQKGQTVVVLPGGLCGLWAGALRGLL